MVRCPDFVPLNIGKLALDDIWPEAGLVQDRARQCPKPMYGGPLMVTEAVEGIKESIFGDRPLVVSLRWKE